jgi:N-acetylmuramoyl-L-alanine amidase CwlA
MSFKMKYEIKKDYLTSGSKRRSGAKMPKVGFMVAHDTGNPNSTAEGNVGYYERSRNDQSASAHIFVDDNSIVECVPFLTGTPEKAWHVIYNVTTDNKMYGDDANDIAGGVELCWGSNINAAEAYKRYVWVLAYACYKFKLNPAKAIVGHEVLDPARKIDPSNGLKKMGSGYTYARLLKDVVNEYNECIGKTSTPVQQPSAITGKTYTIKSGDTFWGIAQRTSGVTVQDLIKWNPSVNATDLKVGQVINISAPASKPAPAPKPTPAPADYIGKRVESIYDGKDKLAFRDRASWSNGDIIGHLAKGEGFPTIVDKVKVEDGYQYKVKNSKGAIYYVTADPSFVKVEGVTASKPAPKPTAPRVLKRGDSGSDVLDMQKKLSSVYFYPEKGAKNNGCDGKFGPATEGALKRFQSVHVGNPTGVYDAKTRAALEKLAK